MNLCRHTRTPLSIALTIAAILTFLACAPKIQYTEVPETTGSGDSLYAQGDNFFQEKAYGQALAVFNEYIARFPGGHLADDALMKMGAIHMAQKDYASARSIYKHLVSKYPKSPYVQEARVGILTTHFHDGNHEELIDSFADIDKGQLQGESATKSHLLMGDAYWVLGKPDQAATHYLSAYFYAAESEKDAVRGKIREAIRSLSPEDLSALIDRTESAAAKDLLAQVAKSFAYSRTTLGCLLPLSGRYTVYGQRALKGVELALARFTTRNPGTDLRIVFKDTSGDPEKTSQAVRDLITENNAAALIGPIITAETAAKEAQLLGIPVMTMTQKDGIATIGDYVFRNFFTPAMQVRSLVTYCTQVLGLDRFAVLHPDEPYGWKFMNLFWDDVVKAGGTVVGAESYDKSLTDFAAPIKKLIGRYYSLPAELNHVAEPPGGDAPFPPAAPNAPHVDTAGATARLSENVFAGSSGSIEGMLAARGTGSTVDFHALFIPDSPKKAGLIIPQLAYHDVRNIYLLGTNLWHSRQMIEMARDYAQGALIPVGFYGRSPSMAVSDFVAAFTDTFQAEPGFIEAIAFDTATILLEAIIRPGIDSRSALRDALLNFGTYEGVTGPTTFDSSGDVLKKLKILRIKGDDFVELQTEAPGAWPGTN